MDTNEQFHQTDSTPQPNLRPSEAREQQAKMARSPNEEAMAANPPEVSLAQSAEPGTLAKTPPQKLANLFASLDAEHTKKAFADLSEQIRDKSEAFACAYKAAAEEWDELTPHLSRMQSLLSQRGEKRKAVLREAGLPSWTEWFESFKKELGWKISLRAVQKKLAVLRDNSVSGKGGNAEGHGQAAKPENERALYKSGYRAAKAEVQEQLNAAAAEKAALEGRVAELEKENEKLQGIAGGLQEQPEESKGKEVARLRAQVEGLREIAGLATEAFKIINGKYGERLMASAEGRRLVEIAKKAAAMRGKLKVL